MVDGDREGEAARKGPSMWSRISSRYQKVLDDLVPHLALRWLASAVVVACYMLRVAWLHGWYIVSYALAIYLLNLFIAFLTPRFDPSQREEDDIAEGPGLPTSAHQEFKPFVRRLPEFKFWYSGTRAVVVAFVLTFFSVFNIPVFWPILVLYFIILFGLTMKRQIMHMIRFRYLPFSYGKRQYKGKETAAS